MIESVLTIGGILAFAVIVLGLFLVKATPKDKYIAYYPGLLLFFGGIILILAASFGKVEFMGAGLGGWGIASILSGSAGLVLTSVFDAYQNNNATNA